MQTPHLKKMFMKKYFPGFLMVLTVSLFVAGCNKTTNLPAYTPPVSVNFSVSSLHHTQDTVHVGDTIYLNAAGTMYDTTKNIYVWLSTGFAAAGVSSVLNYGNASSPVKISRTISGQTNGLYNWASTIMLPGATFVPSKTKLSITGNFIYQLSLSSQQGTLTAADAGQSSKTIYVK
jgi:hypothetical protein